MGLRSSLISLIRGAPIGVIPVLILAATATTGILMPENGYQNHVTIFVLVICTGLVSYGYWFVNNISLLCIQLEPESDFPARPHHFREFDLEEGYSKFDTFVCVPEWMDEFILEFDADSPLEVGLWQVPDDYNENGNTIECSENAHDFSFNLTVGGDTDNLGTADRELRINEKTTGEMVANLTLKSTSTQTDTSYRDQYESEA